MYFFWAVLGLHCCTCAFSRCSQQGRLSRFRARASHGSGSSCFGSRALEHRLGSCGAWSSCPVARAVFSDQGSNPCPLYCKAGSQPPDYQGAPCGVFLNLVFLSDKLKVHQNASQCAPVGGEIRGDFFPVLKTLMCFIVLLLQ